MIVTDVHYFQCESTYVTLYFLRYLINEILTSKTQCEVIDLPN